MVDWTSPWARSQVSPLFTANLGVVNHRLGPQLGRGTSAMRSLIDPLGSARPNVLEGVRASLMPDIARRSWALEAMTGHRTAAEAVTSPIHRAVADLVKLQMPALTPSAWIAARRPMIEVAPWYTAELSPWRAALDSYATTNLRALRPTLTGLGPARADVLARDLVKVNLTAFADVPDAHMRDLFTRDDDLRADPDTPTRTLPPTDAPLDDPIGAEVLAELERALLDNDALAAAIEDVVESEPVSELLDHLEGLDPAELSEAQVHVLRQDAITALVNQFGGLLGALSPNRISVAYGVLYAGMVGVTLQLRGDHDLVGQVADTLAWPLSVIGLASFCGATLMVGGAGHGEPSSQPDDQHPDDQHRD